MTAPKVRETTVVYGHRGTPGRRMRNTGDVHAFITQAVPTLTQQPFESFFAIGLDAKHRICAWSELGRGSMVEVGVDVAGLFRWALLSGVHAVIVAHNHPSGHTEPSPEDLIITRKIVQAGDLLGIEVLDHVIIGDGDGFYSFLASNTLPKART